MESAEQKARDMLERMGVADAQQRSAGELIELATLIAERDRLARVIAFIADAAPGGELYPVLQDRTGLWWFLRGRGSTFVAAVEDEMRRRAA